MAYENVSIKNAIVKLQNRRAQLDSAVDNGVRECAERGVELAKENLHNYEFRSFPSELEQSIKAEKIAENHYQVSADGGFATYVEYGTGIVGENKPHPNASEKNVTYDRNGHGEKGWVYPKGENEFGWTKGQPSRPFMYNTANQLQEEIPQIMKKHLEVE
ncbi:MAG: hypothetical protein RR248_06025 [Clostridia bacterium]